MYGKTTTSRSGRIGRREGMLVGEIGDSSESLISSCFIGLEKKCPTENKHGLLRDDGRLRIPIQLLFTNLIPPKTGGTKIYEDMGRDARHGSGLVEGIIFLYYNSFRKKMPGEATILLAQKLSRIYEEIRVKNFTTRHFQPEILYDALGRIVKQAPDIVSSEAVGTSFEGRPIYRLTTGRGATTVLLWSQMHGDEPTATMAIADILNYLVVMKSEEPAGQILSSLKLHFLPMLNPDGAARCRRRTAQAIDMNRDALALVTPEARILRQLQAALHPQFGFNLHDQELSTVGSSKELTAIGLLVPAFDEGKSDNDVRRRARRLAAIFSQAMTACGEGRIARYDDTFEPRAFGDNMQKWGTSTLLVESGHAMNDPEKRSIRKLNVIGILASLEAIATGHYERADPAAYESLPLNGKKAYDVIIRNVVIDHGRNVRTNADLGISYQIDTHSGPTPLLVDVGDLSTFTALREITASGKSVSASSLTLGQPFDWEGISDQ